MYYQNLLEQSYLKLTTKEHRKTFAQFFTPPAIAELMAAYILDNPHCKVVLDPAAGLSIFASALDNNLRYLNEHNCHCYTADPNFSCSSYFYRDLLTYAPEQKTGSPCAYSQHTCSERVLLLHSALCPHFCNYFGLFAYNNNETAPFFQQLFASPSQWEQNVSTLCLNQRYFAFKLLPHRKGLSFVCSQYYDLQNSHQHAADRHTTSPSAASSYADHTSLQPAAAHVSSSVTAHSSSHAAGYTGNRTTNTASLATPYTQQLELLEQLEHGQWYEAASLEVTAPATLTTSAAPTSPATAASASAPTAASVSTPLTAPATATAKTAVPPSSMQFALDLNKLSHTLILGHGNNYIPAIELVGYEIDPAIMEFNNFFLAQHHLTYVNYELRLKDYLKANFKERYDGIICNPPYLTAKEFAQKSNALALLQEHLGIELPKKLNLYALFLLKSLSQLNPQGRCAYLIPYEFLNSSFGVTLKEQFIKQRNLAYVITFNLNGQIFDHATTTCGLFLFDNAKRQEQIEFITVHSLDELEQLTLRLCTNLYHRSARAQKHYLPNITLTVAPADYASAANTTNTAADAATDASSTADSPTADSPTAAATTDTFSAADTTADKNNTGANTTDAAISASTSSCSNATGSSTPMSAATTLTSANLASPAKSWPPDQQEQYLSPPTITSEPSARNNSLLAPLSSLTPLSSQSMASMSGDYIPSLMNSLSSLCVQLPRTLWESPWLSPTSTAALNHATALNNAAAIQGYNLATQQKANPTLEPQYKYVQQVSLAPNLQEFILRLVSNTHPLDHMQWATTTCKGDSSNENSETYTTATAATATAATTTSAAHSATKPKTLSSHHDAYGTFTLSNKEDAIDPQDSIMIRGRAVPYSQLNPKKKWHIYYQERKVAEHLEHLHTQLGVTLDKLSTFDQFIKVKRGLATGANDFFLFTREKKEQLQLKDEFFVPVIPRANLATMPILTHEQFTHLIERNAAVFLLNAPDHVTDPALQQYLESGLAQNIHHRYLTRHRSPWYSLEHRKVAPIFMSVFNRGTINVVRNEAQVYNLTTFHSIFVLDESQTDLIFAYLITPLAKDIIMQNRREYGGGLEKLEPLDINHAACVNFNALSAHQRHNILQIYGRYRATLLGLEPYAQLKAAQRELQIVRLINLLSQAFTTRN